MITIKEIADIVGVSTTTVNNVILGKTSQVSKATIEKVQKVLDEHNYIPNMNARNLAQNKSKIIGIALRAGKDKYENPIKDSYIGELIGAIEKEVRASEYFLMIYISNDIDEILRYLTTWNVDGLIALGMQGHEGKLMREKLKKPMVFVDSYFYHEVKSYVNVGLEDKKGSYEITKYLLECGHRNIAFLADNRIGVDYERFLGYKKAIEEYGIEHKEEDFFLISPEEGISTLDLENIYGYSKRYTAFVCASDYYAVMIMNYLRDRGINIPHDLSIVGFDDNLYAQIARPALTTVHQDITRKGEVAVEKLLTLVQGKKLKSNTCILPTQIVIRDTVKRVK